MDVQTLLENKRADLGLALVAGRKGLDRAIGGSTIQKPGLALTGFTDLVKPGRVQVLGTTELEYLRSLTPADADRAAFAFLENDPPAVVITDGERAPEELIANADLLAVPLLETELASALFIDALHQHLADELDRVGSIPTRSYAAASCHSTRSITSWIRLVSRIAATPKRSLMLMMPSPRISMWCLISSSPRPMIADGGRLITSTTSSATSR